MDKNELFTFDSIELKPFRPFAAVFSNLDEIEAYVQDTSTITKWHGLLHVEHFVAHNGRLIGVKIVNAKSFTSRFLPKILLLALQRDLCNEKEHSKSKQFVLKLYAKTLWFVLRQPKIWKVEG